MTLLWYFEKNQFDLGIQILLFNKKKLIEKYFASFFNSVRINEKIMECKANVKYTEFF